MEWAMSGKAFLFCFLLALVSQSWVTLAASRNLVEFNDQKNFLHSSKNPIIKPDCHCTDPSHGGGGSSGGHSTPTPSHGGGSSGGHSTPTPTPSHGGGSSGGHSTPTPSHGGGSGGYYHSPPPSPIVVPPVHPTPTPTPIVVPPVTPVNPTPSSPSLPTPSSPDPHTPPFFPGTCNYWSTHPGAIVAIFGYLGDVGQSFGAACGAAFGKSLSLPDALSNTRADGIGALYREGTAAFLNSVACKTGAYPFTTQQVKDAFAAAVVSDAAAAHQAQLFKLANDGGLKH